MVVWYKPLEQKRTLDMPIHIPRTPVKVDAFDPTKVFLAKFDRALSLMPGLFRHIDREHLERSHPTFLEIEYGFNAETRLRVSSDCQLSGFDLSILQGVIGLSAAEVKTISGDNLAGTSGEHCRDEPTDPEASSEGDQADVGAADVPKNLLRVSFPVKDLLSVVGLPISGHYTNAAIASLRRLAGVVLTELSPTGQAVSTCQLITLSQTGTPSSKASRFHAVLCSRLSRAVLTPKAGWTDVSLIECRDLKTDYAARVLHHRLTAQIDNGDVVNLRVGTLMQYLYPRDANAERADAMRCEHDKTYSRASPAEHFERRLNILEKALNVLNDKLKWGIEVKRESAKGPEDTLISIERREFEKVGRRTPKALREEILERRKKRQEKPQKTVP